MSDACCSGVRAERKEEMKAVVLAGIMGFAMAVTVTAQEKPKMNEATASQVIEIQKQIDALKAHKGKMPFLTLSEVGGGATVQLARVEAPGKRTWSLNIAYYPSTENPAKALAAVGMTLPAT